MKVVKERSAIASYDIGMRTRTQLRDTAATQRDARAASPVAAAPAQHQLDKMGRLSLQINQQSSSIQSAQVYLHEVAEHLSVLKRELRRDVSVSAATTPNEEVISRLVTRLNSLLDDRSRMSDGSLDAQLNLKLDEPLRSRFSIKGLESLQAVQASGSETLLFNAGRYMPGPVAVVLDDDMSQSQLLHRMNSALAQAGLHAQLSGADQLSFSADEAHWRKLKGQLSIQGENKLFSKDGFTPIDSQKENLLGTPLAMPKGGREEARHLINTLDKGLQRISGVVEQLKLRQAEAREQLGRYESKDEKRWAHDFVGRLFDLHDHHESQYRRVAQVVLSQAHLSTHMVVGMLG